MESVLLAGKQPFWRGLNYHLANRANLAVLAALKRGDMVRPDRCSRCGQPPYEGQQILAHHDDYAQPLKIDWLCRPCHVVRHYKHPGSAA